jgi:hypothetical protein
MTDEWGGYKGTNLTHGTTNHAAEYVGGTYISVEPFHLDRYVDEQAFRYNNRATKDNPLTDKDRFALVLSQISGKRLTCDAELTGKLGETAV